MSTDVWLPYNYGASIITTYDELFSEYLPVCTKRFRASPLHELWQNKIVGQAGYGYGSLTVFEVTGFHR